MPDITMCKSNDCPIKDKCYRYTAKPSHIQSYFGESPYRKHVKYVKGIETHKVCEFYRQEKI